MFSKFNFFKKNTIRKENAQRWFDRMDNRFSHGINREALIEFQKKLDNYAPSANLESYIKQFQNLPEFIHEMKKVPLAHLTPQARNLFAQITRFQVQDPLAALKLIVLLCCSEKVVFYENSFILMEMIKLIKQWMVSDQLPCQERLEFGFDCYNHWPLTGYYHQHNCDIRFSKEIFTEPLSITFIDYAKQSPDKALLLFDKQFSPDRSSFFLLAKNDSYYFLTFIEFFKEKRPKSYQDALLQYLYDTHYSSGPIAPTKGDINKILSQLYEILTDEQSPYRIDHEKICRYLILYAPPDQSWYLRLPEILWGIEQQKMTNDDRSLENFFISTMNAPEGAIFLPEVCNRYKKWAKNYLTFSQDDIESFLEHSKNMLQKIYDSLSIEYPRYRNKKSSILQQNMLLIETTADTYWEMAEWLFTENTKLYFYVLAVAIAKDHMTSDVTDKIAEKAQNKFLDHFEAFVKNDSQGCIDVIVYMIRQTQFSNYTEYLSPFLSELFPLFLKIDTDTARTALENGLDFHRNDRQPVWEPRDLRTNPLYEGINIRPVFYL